MLKFLNKQEVTKNKRFNVFSVNSRMNNSFSDANLLKTSFLGKVYTNYFLLTKMSLWKD